VEYDGIVFRKTPPIQAYIQPRRRKALQITKHKLLIYRTQIYTLLSAQASCAGRHCQDNINTEMETQRRWHTVLRVKGLTYWQFSISLPSVLVNMCVVWDVKFKGIPNMDVQTAANVRTLPVKSSELLPDSSRTYKVRSEYPWSGRYQFSGR